MILDTFDNIAKYNLHPNILAALKEGISKKAGDFPAEKFPLSDDDYMFLTEYTPASSGELFFEAHKKRIDVMVMVEGDEVMYIKPTSRLSEIVKPYDDDSDYFLAALDDDYTTVRLKTGMFVIIFPEDAHCAGYSISNPSTSVKKAIGKVKVLPEML